MNDRPLVVAGMHRSGTSYVASALAAGGVAMGDRLFGATFANVRGHFEDLDVTALHARMLQAHGAPAPGWFVVNDPAIEARFEDEARRLIEARTANASWGWKDPRTTLFLDFWAKLLPQANFVLVYRAPWEVVDSLYRRGDYDILVDPMLAVRAWLEHNARVVRFARAHPDQTLIVNVRGVAAFPAWLTSLLTQRFGAALNPPPHHPIFEPGLLHGLRQRSFEELAVSTYVPEAVACYRELEAIAAIASPDELDAQPASLEELAVPVFTHWQYVRSVESNARMLHLRTDRSVWSPASRKRA